MSATTHCDGVMVTTVLEWAGPIKTVTEILSVTPTEDRHTNRLLMAPDLTGDCRAR